MNINRSHFVMLFVGLVIGLLLNFWNTGAVVTKAESNSEKNYVTILMEKACTPDFPLIYSTTPTLNSFSDLLISTSTKVKKNSDPSPVITLTNTPVVEVTPIPTEEIPEVIITPEPTENPDIEENQCHNGRDNYNSQGNHNCSDNNPNPNSNQQRNKDTD